MRSKQLWLIISSLVLLNCLTIIFFLFKEHFDEEKSEVVATIGDVTISRQDWLSALEKNYGKETLKQLVDEKVIEKIAEKYHITVSDTAVERELLLLKTMYGTAEHGQLVNNEEQENNLKIKLLLEEIITKDVVIPEEELYKFYEENEHLFHIPTSYHISQIVVRTKEEADQTLRELEEGSSFSVLAKERSIDFFHAAQGGNIGFIQEGEGQFSKEYFDVIETLSPNEWSQPISVEDGYVIIMLHEKIAEREFSFEEVKDEIRRIIALQQMNGQPNLFPFWEELNVKWFYEEY